MRDYIIIFICAIIFAHFVNLLCYNFYDCKYFFNKRLIVIMTVFATFLTIISLNCNEFLKVLGLIFWVFLYIKWAHHLKFKDNIVITMFIYIVKFVSTYVLNILNFLLLIMGIKTNIFIFPFFVYIFDILFGYLLMYYIFTIINNAMFSSQKQIKIGYWPFWIIALIFIIFISDNKNLFMISFNNDIYYLGFISLTTIFLILYFFKQYYETKNLIIEYKNIVNYVNKNEELIQKYRRKIHENRNQLIFIRNMIDDTNIELVQYLDNLINLKNNDSNSHEWIHYNLMKIKLSGLRGFLEYKLEEIRSLGINIEISVSSDLWQIKSSDFNAIEKEHLYTIVGVLIDNAKESLVASNYKHFSFQMYSYQNNIYLILANEICNHFDSTFLYKENYSTKGFEHGNGLNIVKKITKRSSLYNLKTDILNNYFIQTLTIIPKTTEN